MRWAYFVWQKLLSPKKRFFFLEDFFSELDVRLIPVVKPFEHKSKKARFVIMIYLTHRIWPVSPKLQIIITN